MDPSLPDHIVELATAARRAFADAGGVDLARRAELDGSARADAAGALGALGGLELDALADADQALAAFALCREAGRVALPYPVDSVAVRAGGTAVVLVSPADPLVDHADLLGDRFGDLAAVDLAGAAYAARADGAPLASRLAPFAVPVALAPATPGTAGGAVADAATMAWVLASATTLGYVEGALDLCVAHARDRHQFGQRIADFQAVQFQVADAVVAAAGLAELALFTVWRVTELGAGARTDALALRLHASDVARASLRIAQQLHGASGVCEEYDVSVLCRRVQTSLRIPVSSERVLDALVDATRHGGFASLFPQGVTTSR